MTYSLRDRRLELGLTLEDVAQSVGVGKSTVRKWETGDIQNMGRDKILALSRTLKISPIDIIDPDGEIPSGLVHEITTISGKLTPVRQQHVYDFAVDQFKQQTANADHVEDTVVPLPASGDHELDPLTTIAAHIDDDATDEDKQAIQDFIDKIKREHENPDQRR